MPVGVVVADGVVDEVGDEAFDQSRVPGRHCRRQVFGEVHASLCSPVATGGKHSCDDSGEVEGVPAGDAALAGGQGEQCLDEPFLVSAECEGFLAGRAQGVDVGVGVGEGDFEEGSQASEGGAQLVGGVGDEVPLSVEGGFEAAEQVVEDVAQLGQLVGGLAEVEALVEVPGGDGLGGGGDGPQRPEEAAGDEPAGREGDGDEDDERDGGADEELVRADPVPGAGDCCLSAGLAGGDGLTGCRLGGR